MNERPEKSRFGDLLLEMRLVEEGELASAMAERAQTGRRLAQVLADRRVIDEERLTKAVAAQLSLETVALRGHRTHPQVLARLPADVARTYGVLPYAIKRTPRSDILFLVMSDPLDTTALSEAHRHSGCQVRVMLAGASALEHAIREHYGPEVVEPPIDISEDILPIEAVTTLSIEAASPAPIFVPAPADPLDVDVTVSSPAPALPPFERMTSVSSIQPPVPINRHASISEGPTIDMPDDLKQTLSTAPVSRLQAEAAMRASSDLRPGSRQRGLEPSTEPSQPPLASPSPSEVTLDGWRQESGLHRVDEWTASSTALHAIEALELPDPSEDIASPFSGEPRIPTPLPAPSQPSMPAVRGRRATLTDVSPLALEVPIESLDDRHHPFLSLLMSQVPVGLEKTGIIPEIRVEPEPFEPPPPEHYPSDPRARQGLCADDIPKNPAEVAARSAGGIDEIDEGDFVDFIQVEAVEESPVPGIDAAEVRAALMESGIGGGEPTEIDDDEVRWEPTTSVFSLDEGHPPPLPPQLGTDAERMVEALLEGASLTSSDRAQLVLAIGRLLLDLGVIERDALVDQLERQGDS